MGNNHVVIVGGSGFIGTHLSKKLIEKGYAVTVVDISKPKVKGVSFVSTDMMSPELFDTSKAVINLAGVTIGKRWSRSYKKLIYTSRIDTTKKIIDCVHRSNNKPEVFVSASAIGYYGDRGNQVLVEEEPSGNDFLAYVCKEWEEEAQKSSTRTVVIRTAHVLGKGGLLAKIKPLLKRGLGASFGSGNQYMPWIHLDDIVGVYIYAIENQIEGVFNVGAGKTPTQNELFKEYARSLGKPFVLKIPRVLVKIVLGEFGDTLCSSQRTVSGKLLRTGYQFKVASLDEACRKDNG